MYVYVRVLQDDAGVDYAAMRKSAGFVEYSALAKELGDEDLDLATMSELGALLPVHILTDFLRKMRRLSYLRTHATSKADILS